MQKCKFIMEHLRITQGYGRDAIGEVDNRSYSHTGSYALDLGGKDTGIGTAYAPCDVVVKRIYGTYNAVWFETLEEVMCADGQARKLVFMLLHCNSADIKALGIKVGKIFKQGEPFYKEGTAGKVTGAHIHIEVGEAPFTGTGWHKSTIKDKTGSYVWVINNQLIPHDIFFLDKDTVVLNDGGYDWGIEVPVQPLSEKPVRLKIGYASSGDINTMVDLLKDIGGISAEVKDGYIYTTEVSKGDQVAILIKCDELKIGCVIYEEPATEENSVVYLVGPISIENQAEFEAECQKLGVPFEVCEEIADETPEKTTIEAVDEPKQLYIGPMSGGDRATLFNMAAELLLVIDDSEERYLTVGPASKGDQAAIIAKCEELQIPCYFYEAPTDVEEPERDEPVGDADKLPADELTFDEIGEIISSTEKKPAEQPEADRTQEPEPEKPEADKEPAKEENGENEANTGAGAEDTNVPGKEEPTINKDTYWPDMWEDLPSMQPEQKRSLAKWLVKLIKKLLG